MKMKRYVEISSNVYPTLEHYFEKCDKAMKKSSPESHKYKEGERLLEELKHAKKIVDNVAYIANPECNYCICQDDEGARFYRVDIVEPKVLRKHIENNHFRVCHNINVTNSLDMRGFDKSTYINFFQFSAKHDVSSEYAFELFKSELYKREIFATGQFRPIDFDQIKEDISFYSILGK